MRIFICDHCGDKVETDAGRLPDGWTYAPKDSTWKSFSDECMTCHLNSKKMLQRAKAKQRREEKKKEKALQGQQKLIDMDA